MEKISKSTLFILEVFRDKYGIDDELVLKYFDFLSVEKNAKNIIFIAVNLEMIYSKSTDFKKILNRKMIKATEFLIEYPYTDIVTIKNLVLQEEKDFIFL